MEAGSVRIIRPGEGRRGTLGGFGVRFLVPGGDSQGGFALVEHPLAPRALAAPLHRHSREDEFSYITRGRIGLLLGQQVIEAGPGDLIFKPRRQWHTFWNAGDESASLLEIISPAGFERYFEELIGLFPTGEPEPDKILPVAQRYGLEIDLSTMGELCAQHGLTLGPPS